MDKVAGIADYSVYVECPACGAGFNTIDKDDDNEITGKMFENTVESCTDMDVLIACPHCDCEFILNEIEY